MIVFTVRLNGTDTNPWHTLRLTHNPFPQLGRAEYDQHMLHLARLDGDPIPDTDYIRNHLRGWSPEFIELCCKQFRKGELVAFDVVWRGDE